MEQEKEDLLKQLTQNSAKQLFYARLTAIAALVLMGAVILCLMVVVPKVLVTVENADTAIVQAQETIELANDAILEISEMSSSVTSMSQNMDTFINENAKSAETVMESLGSIDFEDLNSAIKDLGDVVEPLANFFGKFK